MKRTNKIINTEVNEAYYNIRVNKRLLQIFISKTIDFITSLISVLAFVFIIGLSEAIINAEASTTAIIIFILSILWLTFISWIFYKSEQ